MNWIDDDFVECRFCKSHDPISGTGEYHEGVDGKNRSFTSYYGPLSEMISRPNDLGSPSRVFKLQKNQKNLIVSTRKILSINSRVRCVSLNLHSTYILVHTSTSVKFESKSILNTRRTQYGYRRGGRARGDWIIRTSVNVKNETERW